MQLQLVPVFGVINAELYVGYLIVIYIHNRGKIGRITAVFVKVITV